VLDSRAVPSRLPHGYTNTTRRIGAGRILKRYEGPGRHERWRRELLCLAALGAHLPVPAVLERDDEEPSLVLTELPGRPGQELIDEGHGDEVMALVGQTLRLVQAIPLTAVPHLDGRGSVLVHGDFGPQNMLFDLDADLPVVGLVDWEFAHRGDPVEDVAWAEWIVRTHHGAHVDAAEHLLREAPVAAPWPERHAAMLRRCAELVAQAAGRGSAAGVELWRRRLTDTEGWRQP